ncbi:hypothetical protein QF032_002161 [Streptomyces achromogenes]|uniref:hypothetical protein n=1 Tax=Streptomyces achromogenes TaxID=67255 RepID=UPI0027800FE2|nr:hypothetical protein [Streptomyces achromogenes]MDQ0830317.1 hypothetical protein [Streptomyces achromogenes]
MTGTLPPPTETAKPGQPGTYDFPTHPPDDLTRRDITALDLLESCGDSVEPQCIHVRAEDAARFTVNPPRR